MSVFQIPLQNIVQKSNWPQNTIGNAEVKGEVKMKIVLAKSFRKAICCVLCDLVV